MRSTMLAMYAVVVMLTACGEPNELEKVSRNITDYKGTSDSGGNKYLLINLKSGGWDGGKRDLTTASEDMFNSAKWVAKRYPEIPYIRFTISADMVDRYQNSAGSKEVLSMSYLMSDLKKMNWDKIFPFSLLDFAEDVKYDRHGRDMLVKYCADADSVKWAPRFCANYR